MNFRVKKLSVILLLFVLLLCFVVRYEVILVRTQAYKSAGKSGLGWGDGRTKGASFGKFRILIPSEANRASIGIARLGDKSGFRILCQDSNANGRVECVVIGDAALYTIRLIDADEDGFFDSMHYDCGNGSNRVLSVDENMDGRMDVSVYGDERLSVSVRIEDRWYDLVVKDGGQWAAVGNGVLKKVASQGGVFFFSDMGDLREQSRSKD